ncbi:MAG TPA: hypothetical protein VMN79_08760 [Casimicrobiaceae bacterium]|nr:hypothetical protein [Casimicrobiaceae bacterium]
MIQPVKSIFRTAAGATLRSTLAGLGAALALGSAGSCLAQGAQVNLHQEATVYRAFYYDEQDHLLHVEVVNDISGRHLTPLFTPAKQAAPQSPPSEGPATLIGDKARYAIYYGTSGPNQPKFQAGDRDPQSRPVAIERLSAADAHRAIECASPGGDACLFPRMCHCGAVGSCCCY